jgi:adenylate cyclase
MSSGLKSKNRLKLTASLCAGMLGIVFLLLLFRGTVWSQWDFKALDMFHRKAAASGRIPNPSSQIVYLLITDNTYKYFQKNFLDRKDLATINDIFSEFEPEAVAYDIIFARPSKPDADGIFADSIRRLETVYLPFGLDLSSENQPFRWEAGTAYDHLRNDYLKNPIEKGAAEPFHAVRALMQLDSLSEAAESSGHITVAADPDGVYRHMAMLVKIDDRYVPTLALAVLLKYAGVDFEDVTVHWGRELMIPAAEKGNLETDVHIPIDGQGRAYIPFARSWQQGFPKMEAHSLVSLHADKNLSGNLSDFFEGNFVFVGDVSAGASDIGHTPLESDAPLIMIHTALLNGMLTDTFYRKWSFEKTAAAIFLVGCLLFAAGIPKSSWILYLAGALILVGIFFTARYQFTRYQLFPPVTVAAAAMLIFWCEVIGIGISVYKERRFIRHAFSRYLPETVVNELVENPELLKLGGEEQTLTVLFSDLADFTSFSEKIPPSDLVHILNTYLTEMTDIVLAQGGIIDKYQGDAIMAEFGAPLFQPDHADRAVSAGLRMHRQLDALSAEWRKKNFPDLACRIGINTGPMVVGNMGSQQVFDYTVIGDAVNLASRLEGANKRYNTRLMISEFTFNAMTPGRFRTRLLDVIRVKGKSKAVKVFEVYGEMSEAVDPDRERYCQAFHKGFEAYLACDFISARKHLRLAASIFPDDPAAADVIRRMEGIDPHALPDSWDGSIALQTK